MEKPSVEIQSFIFALDSITYNNLTFSPVDNMTEYDSSVKVKASINKITK